MTAVLAGAGYSLAGLYGARQRSVAAGSELFEQGEAGKGLFIVGKGWAFQYLLRDDGRRQILNFALPGSVIGFSRMADGSMGCSAEALTDLIFTEIRQSTMDRLQNRDAKFSGLLAAASREAIREAHDVTFEVGWRNAQESVSHLLLRLFTRSRSASPPGPSNSVDCPLTLEHIGDALALSSVHVCRTLRSLREHEILSLSQRRLTILNQALLGLAADKRTLSTPRRVNGKPSISFPYGAGSIAFSGG